MDTNNTNQNTQEIDLGAMAGSIGKSIKKVFDALFGVFTFFWKYKFLSALLFVLGFVGGFFLDVKPATYEHVAIVVPNFKSVDDVYAKVTLIESKILDQDTDFFKAIGIEEPKLVRDIKIEAIVDPFRFVEYNKDRFEMIKLMADDSNVNSVIQNDVTTRNYINHKLTIHTREKIESREIIDKILLFLNSNPYFAHLQKIQIDNSEKRLFEYDTTLKHIDNILAAFGKSGAIKTNASLVGDNVAIDQVIVLRDRFVREREQLRLERTLFDKIVKDISLEMNLRGKETFGGKAKFYLPLILLGLFFVFMRKKG